MLGRTILFIAYSCWGTSNFHYVVAVLPGFVLCPVESSYFPHWDGFPIKAWKCPVTLPWAWFPCFFHTVHQLISSFTVCLTPAVKLFIAPFLIGLISLLMLTAEITQLCKAKQNLSYDIKLLTRLKEGRCILRSNIASYCYKAWNLLIQHYYHLS